MRVVERFYLLRLRELLVDWVDLRQIRLGPLQFREFRLEVPDFRHLVKELADIRTLLGGDLGRRGIRGRGAVPDGIDAPVRPGQHHVVVDRQPAAVRLGLAQFRDEVLRDRPEGVAPGPDEQSERDLDALAVRVGDDDGLWFDFPNHGFREEVDLVLLEGPFGVGDELLREHGEHVGKGLDEGDFHPLGEFWR